jgi:hypothetical protein
MALAGIIATSLPERLCRKKFYAGDENIAIALPSSHQAFAGIAMGRENPDTHLECLPIR